MPASPAEAAPALRLAQVHAGYRDRPVLKGLSLTIAAGEAYALLGPNGAGKSTAARVACGLLRPERGTVSVGGPPPALSADRGRHVGLAPQDCALFPALTIRENLETIARLGSARSRRGDRAWRTSAVADALQRTDCTARADERVSSLSGGWRRRANLAAALVSRPSLVVLDEPTEGVDARTRTTLVRAVRDTLDTGAGCLIISHDAAFVTQAADRVGILADGRLIAEGPLDALLAQTFGEHRLLTVRFANRPSEALTRKLTASSLESKGDALVWRRVGADVLDLADQLADAIDGGAGEMIIRRPGLDELLDRLLESRS